MQSPHLSFVYIRTLHIPIQLLHLFTMFEYFFLEQLGFIYLFFSVKRELHRRNGDLLLTVRLFGAV